MESSLGSEQSVRTQLNSYAESNLNLTREINTKTEEIRKLKLELADKNIVIDSLKAEIERLRPAGVNTKKRIKPELSKIMRQLYPTLDDDAKFDTQLAIDDPFNVQKLQDLKAVLDAETDKRHSASELTIALKSRYWVEKKAANILTPVKESKRRLTRRHNKLKRRLNMASGDLKTMMLKLSADDMSDEHSDNENAGTLRIKRPAWRTPEIQNTIQMIDEKISQQAKRPRHSRVEASPSTRVQRNN